MYHCSGSVALSGLLIDDNPEDAFLIGRGTNARYRQAGIHFIRSMEKDNPSTHVIPRCLAADIHLFSSALSPLICRLRQMASYCILVARAVNSCGDSMVAMLASFRCFIQILLARDSGMAVADLDEPVP
jgi:hypothetical protein